MTRRAAGPMCTRAQGIAAPGQGLWQGDFCQLQRRRCALGNTSYFVGSDTLSEPRLANWIGLRSHRRVKGSDMTDHPLPLEQLDRTMEPQREEADSLRRRAEQDLTATEERRASAESARNDAEEFRRLAEQARKVLDERRDRTEAIRNDGERLREAGETMRVSGEDARVEAEAARHAAMDAVQAAAETLQATLENMKVVEGMRRTLRDVRDANPSNQDKDD